MTSGRADLTIAVLPPQVTDEGTAPGGFGLVMTTATRGITELTGWTPRAPLSGQRCLTRRAFELASPLAAGWGMEVGMTIDILRAGLRVEEIEIELRHRATGRDLAGQLHRAKQLRDVTRALVTRGAVNADTARDAPAGLAELKDAGRRPAPAAPPMMRSRRSAYARRTRSRSVNGPGGPPTRSGYARRVNPRSVDGPGGSASLRARMVATRVDPPGVTTYEPGTRMTATKRRSGHPAKAKPVYRPTVWHRHHRWGLFGIVAATGLTLLAGFLGPSAVTITLGPRDSLLPPWYLPAGILEPNEWLVSAMIWSAILVGAVGLWVAMRALADGWKPKARRIFGLGVALTLLTITVPPMTSADVLMYAAYGRLQAIGMSPYDITPAEVFRGQFDPVLKWVEFPWHDTPSVYGPITSWTQLLANRLGGENMHDIVFWLQVFSAVPVHHRRRRGGAAGPRRRPPPGPGRAAHRGQPDPDLGRRRRRAQRGAVGDVRGGRDAVHAQEPVRRRHRHRAGRLRQAEHRPVGAGHALGLPPRAEEGAAALRGDGDPDGAGVRGLAADRVLPGAAQRRLRLGRLLGPPLLPVLQPVPDPDQRQDRGRGDLLRRADRDRLDAVPHRAVDGCPRLWPRARTCGRTR